VVKCYGNESEKRYFTVLEKFLKFFLPKTLAILFFKCIIICNKIMFIRTQSLSSAFQLFAIYVRINIISELFKLVEKIKQFNFKLNSSNDPFILLYYFN